MAYGRDGLKGETRDALLHGQLQEGLRLDIMKGPAVSGAQSYLDLCVAAKNEERRLLELRRKQQYQKAGPQPSQSSQSGKKTSAVSPSSEKQPPRPETRRCYICDKPGHLANRCKQKRSESGGRAPPSNRSSAKQVQSDARPRPAQRQKKTDPIDLLLSSSEEETVHEVRIADKGSVPQSASVLVQGVPADGIIDSGADITIVGGDLFRKVAAMARLKKRDFKKADRTPRTYDQKTFTLDGRMDLDISFDGKTMNTAVYVKMDAHDQLLLSEGVCRQLGLIIYHRDVRPLSKGQKTKNPPAPLEEQEKSDAQVPTVRVSLVQSLHLLPHQSALVQVQVESHCENGNALLLEHSTKVEDANGLLLENALIQPDGDGFAQLVISNPTGCSCTLEGGTHLGEAERATLVVEPELGPSSNPPTGEHTQSLAHVRMVQDVAWRKQRLRELIGKPELLSEEQAEELHVFLSNYHGAFCIEEEGGETDLVEMEIHTGDAAPRRVPARRMPFAVRQEVSRQLRSMQDLGVVQPSNSPWASPVVMVRKKDGTHRFCIDYRGLNAVTKADTFPLPRIDDLLDQLGESRYFSTLDLASGYWQIRVDPGSREKTAFVTPQGLFEFRVMPFGLMNAPAVFQRLMQRVLHGLNPESGVDFVSVYIDDILVFSRTLEEHLEHLCLVIQRIQSAGLKLKPSKCCFIRKEVEFLGHVLTPDGVKTNPKLVAAVADFPQPQNVAEVRQFLGLSSYYRRFIPQFAAIAQPLHSLTCKGAKFQWTEDCKRSFELLKGKLVSAPVLAYPSFRLPFTLETDASIRGIGAILSQPQRDGQLHPVAYASRSLTPSERNYSVTELETLAVVWAVAHFHAYLYGHSVTIYTDHTAVKAILETPNPSGKHARWWTKVYGSGVGEVKIVYQPGRGNKNADALSRSPQAPAPEEGIGEPSCRLHQ